MTAITEIVANEKMKLAEAIKILYDLTLDMRFNKDKICISNAIDYMKICAFIEKNAEELKKTELQLNCILAEEIKREKIL